MILAGCTWQARLQGTISTTTVSVVALTRMAGTVNSTHDTARSRLPPALAFPVLEYTVKGNPSSRTNISDVISRSFPSRRTVVFSVTCRGLTFTMDTRGDSGEGITGSPITPVSSSGEESGVGSTVGALVTTIVD